MPGRVEVRVPVLGESVVEATIGAWLKHEGDAVEAGEPLVQLETDKVNVDVSADQSGQLSGIAVKEGDTVHPGDVLATIEAGAPAAAASPSVQDVQRPHASPVARRLAEEHGVDLTRVEGTGTGGRVTREDVERMIQPAPRTQPAPAPAAISTNGQRPEKHIRMSRRRQTIASRLLEAQRTAAMLTTFNEVDMSAIMDIRARRRDSFQKQHGVNLGFMSFFTSAVVGALREFPNLNAEVRGDEIIQHGYYDIGIAVGAEGGLVVPIVRDADQKSFAELEREIAELAQKARDNTLALDDLRGGTFTITNGGVFGSLLSTPILSPPQVGILGMHKIQPRPVAIGTEVQIRPMMYLALTYDHRIVDGREAVQFLVRVKDLVEDPMALLLD